MTTAILWPTFALVLLIFVVWVTLIVQRLGHIKRNPPKPEELATTAGAARYFEPVAMPGNNLVNLFEMPVLFFALVPLLLMTHHAGHIEVILAWFYVALRAVHSFIHIGPKQVTARFMVYLVSCIILSAMWIGFAFDMATGS